MRYFLALAGLLGTATPLHAARTALTEISVDPVIPRGPGVFELERQDLPLSAGDWNTALPAALSLTASPEAPRLTALEPMPPPEAIRPRPLAQAAEIQKKPEAEESGGEGTLQAVEEASERIGSPAQATDETIRPLYEGRLPGPGGALALGAGPSFGPVNGGLSRSPQEGARLFSAAELNLPRASLAAPRTPLLRRAAGLAGRAWRSLLGSPGPEMKRDAALANALLERVGRLADWAQRYQPALAPEIGRLADAVVVGDFRRAAESVARIAKSPSRQKEARDAILEETRGLLPVESSPAAAAFRRALQEVRSSARGDPFGLQGILSRVVEGLSAGNIPRNLFDTQIWLTKKASAAARARAALRQDAPLDGPLQAYEDCWLHALYFLPLPALDGLRRRISYERFLSRVESLFPDKDIRGSGLDLPEFQTLLSHLGLRAQARAVSEEELTRLLERHGAVIAAIGWFTQDASEMKPFEALRFWHQHAVAITGAVQTGEGRQFVVRDSLLPFYTRYSKTELDVMSLVIFEVEPQSPELVRLRLGEFLPESPHRP